MPAGKEGGRLCWGGYATLINARDVHKFPEHLTFMRCARLVCSALKLIIATRSAEAIKLDVFFYSIYVGAGGEGWGLYLSGGSSVHFTKSIRKSSSISAVAAMVRVFLDLFRLTLLDMLPMLKPPKFGIDEEWSRRKRSWRSGGLLAAADRAVLPVGSRH